MGTSTLSLSVQDVLVALKKKKLMETRQSLGLFIKSKVLHNRLLLSELAQKNMVFVYKFVLAYVS